MPFITLRKFASISNLLSQLILERYYRLYLFALAFLLFSLKIISFDFYKFCHLSFQIFLFSNLLIFEFFLILICYFVISSVAFFISFRLLLNIRLDMSLDPSLLFVEMLFYSPLFLFHSLI